MKVVVDTGRRIAIAAGVVAVLVVASPVPARAASSGSIAVAPAPGSSLVPGGAYFLVHSAAGASFRQSVVVTNLSPVPVSAAVEGVDATSVAGSQAVYGAPQQAATGAGAWIVAARNPVPLGAGATSEIGFSVAVPVGARPGEYLAGISVSTSAGSQAPVRTGGLGVAVDTQIQHVVAVEIEVPGAPATPSLEVTRTAFARDSRGPVLVVGVANVGNGIARGTVAVTVPAAQLERELPSGTLLPGAAVDYRVPWPADRATGPDPLDVSLQYGSRSRSWTGRIGEAGSASPARASRPVSGTGSSGLPVGVVILIAGLGAGAVGCALLVLGRRRPAGAARGRPRRAGHR